MWVWGRNSFTRDKLVDIGFYSVGNQAQGFFPREILAPPPYMGQDYQENGVGEKRGRVRLNRLSGRKMSERYGERKVETSFSERARECRSQEIENQQRVRKITGS